MDRAEVVGARAKKAGTDFLNRFAATATHGVTQKPTPLKFRGLIAIVAKFFFYESVQ
jgi:hypothetical protein